MRVKDRVRARARLRVRVRVRVRVASLLVILAVALALTSPQVDEPLVLGHRVLGAVLRRPPARDHPVRVAP